MTEPTAPQRGALVRVIAGREISVKLHDKGFIASTIVFLVVIVAAVAIPALIGGGTPEYRVGVAPGAEQVVDAAAGLGALPADERPPGVPEAQVDSVPVEEPQAALESDDSLTAVVSVDGDQATIYGRDGVPEELRALITTAGAQATIARVSGEAGLTDAQLDGLLAPPVPDVVLTDPGPDHAVPPELLVLVFGFLFYFAVLTFGMSIAQSVVEEKQSRVVELLVAAVPMRWMLAGKVAGNTVLAIAQVALIVGAGLVGAALTGSSDVVSQALGASGWFLAFFLGGFLMLACLWAVAGSLASRIEDLQSTTLYMQLAVMIPFFSAIFITDDGWLQRVLSYFPLTAPLLMPARMLHGNAAPWEPWAALAIVLATAVVLIGVGARLYSGSVLNTSKRTSLVAAWRAGSGA
ncbi:ABC transporter permease [Demequina activiva]|uniref:ABC transporter permease n=1 Tax=Demequina activiva TaxID=1582364 RepID=A0A919Q483_9MICO|nr:ABC transporter permease [Demequina activiva]GIG54003.1 ABC transporter permease [Demequina activiva]